MIYRILKKRGVADTLLIVAPLIICNTTWNPNSPDSELNKWQQFRGFKALLLHGSKKDKLVEEDADIYIVTPEGLKWLQDKMKTRAGRELRRKFHILAIDESTTYKHYSSQRFKSIKLILDYFRFRYILSGEPAANSIENLFSQIYILDQGRSLGLYVTHFRNKYMVRHPHIENKWLPKVGCENEVYDRLKDLVIRMDQDDYLTLPPISYIDRVIELDPKSQKIYNEMEDDLITQIQNDTVIANHMGIASQKCRQIANGGLYLDKDRKKHKDIHMMKADMAASIVDELGGKPAIIVFEFKHDLQRLLKKFGKNTPYIDGSTSAKEIESIMARWNNGLIPVLLGQYTKVARGVNFQYGGRAIIWHSNTYDREIYAQMIARIKRRGQTRKMFVYHIMIKNSVDYVMKATRKRKGDMQKALLDQFKVYIRTRKKSN